MPTPQKPRTFTFISRSAPYGNNRPRLCLDAALATAVFEQKVNYLFMDDGVFQLLANQNADGIASKTLGNALETLELYGIDQVMVLKESLASRHISSEDLLFPVQLLSNSDLQSLIESSDYVINL
jgi:tRNA 2-thiouridine synthesizing protein C